MANTQAGCTSFKQDLLNGLHAFGTTVVRAGTGADSFKAALYLQSGSQGAGTTAYSATNEVSGTNYTAGGVAIGAWTGPTTAGTTAYTTPTASFVFSNVNLTTLFDCALIYNNTLAGKNSVAVYTFGAQTISNGTLTLSMPTNDSSNAFLRLA
jgi:hypothetical protein